MKEPLLKDKGTRQSLLIAFVILAAVVSASTVSYYYDEGKAEIIDALEVPVDVSEAVIILTDPVAPIEVETSETSPEAVVEVVVYITKDDVITALHDPDVTPDEFDTLFSDWVDQEYSQYERTLIDVEIAIAKKEESDFLESSKPWWKKVFKSKAEAYPDAVGTE